MKTLIFLGIPKKFELRAAKKYAKVIILQRQDSVIEIDSSRQELLLGVEAINYQDIDNELFTKLSGLIDPLNTYVSINERTIIEAHKIITHFKLPQSLGITPKIVDMLSDKSKFRNSFVNDAAHSSRSLIINEKQDLLQAVKQVGRLIVKPVKGEASTDVMIVGSEQEAELVWGHISLAKRRDKNVSFLAEEYFEGDQYSVDVYWSNAQGYRYTPLCKQIIGYDMGYQDFRTCYSSTVADMDETKYAEITAKLSGIFESNNMKLAIMHVEFRINTQGELFVVEINPRIGGLRNLIYHISYDFSHIDNVIKSIVGIDDLVIKSDLIRNSAVLHFWANEVGAFNSIKFHKVEDSKVDVHLERIEAKTGVVVGPPAQGYRKVGYTVISIDKSEDTDKVFAEVFTKTRVTLNK
jgi:hypothetical protein